MLLCGASAGACSGLAFREDTRLSISSPEDRSTVELPVRLSWSVTDFKATGIDGSDDPSRGAFAVFFDRAPMVPGTNLASLAEDDTRCRKPECPNDEWFRQRFIFITTEASLNVAVLPDLRDRPRGLDRHEVTIVLVNGQGRRIGESAFAREFYVERVAERGQDF